MAFDIRCPECKAKLRLDEAPDPDTPIECPRCGSTFTAPKGGTAPPAKKKKADKAAGKPTGEKPKGKTPKKKKAKKKKTNPAILLVAIALGFAGLIGVGIAMAWVLNRPGSVTEMLTYVPGDCNHVRGVNVGQLSRYPGYKSQMDNVYTADIRAAADELAKAANQDPETFVTYLVIARNRTGGATGIEYVLRTTKSVNLDFPRSVSGAAQSNVGGETCYKMPARAGGVLAGATVYVPSGRVVVIVPPGGGTQDGMLRGATAGKGNKAESFAGKLDATGKQVVKGSIWLLIRATGGMKDYPAATVAPVKDDFKGLADRVSKSPTFGVWSTPGGQGVRVGVAIQCSDAKEASELVKSMKEGPLGKGDESEPTNQMKTALGQLTGNKKLWSEFTQYLEFRKAGECAYLQSQVTGENATAIMTMVNNPSMGTGSTGPAGGGFMPGPPGGGPSQPGLPGGIANPGMGPGP